MKALEILKRLQNSDYFDRKKLGLPKEYTLDSAIAELEEVMKHKNCDGCKYLNGVICNHDRGLYCVRQFEEDYFQQKEQ